MIHRPHNVTAHVALHVTARISAIEDLKDQAHALRVYWSRIPIPAQLRAAAHQARATRGHQQVALLRWMEDFWRGKPGMRGIFIGRKDLAKRLGGLDDRNTRRRLKRFEQLGVIRIEKGRGRKRGCRKDGKIGLVGLANKYYPGPLIVPTPWTDRAILYDNQREEQQLTRTRPVLKGVDEPPPDATPYIEPGRFRQLTVEQARAGP